METLTTTNRTAPAKVADFARWKHALEAQARAFFDSEGTNEQTIDTESTVSALLLWEFEQAEARSAGRLKTSHSGDQKGTEFIFRNTAGTRADERFRLSYDKHGELEYGVCQTDFGSLDDPLYQIWAKNNGTFGCEVLGHTYHDDETVSYAWQELPEDQAHAILNRFGAESTKSFEVYWKRIEAGDGSQQEADESAKAISARMGHYILHSPSVKH